jgi:hypothetical protein
MNFCEAFELLKANKLVAREGWDRKRQFVFVGFPHVQVYRENEEGAINIHDARESFKCNYVNPTLCMKTADNMIAVGWFASQKDLFSDDWIEIEYPAKPDDLE